MSKDRNERNESLQMDRRQFLGTTGVGGALLMTGIVGCAPQRGTGDGREQTHVDVDSFELDEVTLDGIREGIESGRWTSERITGLYLDRIEALDRSGPGLRAVLETNPDALQIAAELDREHEAGNVRGPLHGVPILLKDNIATADHNTTTAGSFALEGYVAAEDATVAARLRAAGAVLLGKANLSEWANFRSTRSSSGWSARGGQCRNPYILSRNPCGSSSGSGVAVAANLCAAAIGTETDGSIVCPSSANGIVGIKPTVGLIGRTRIVPISHTQDTAGPMARTVRDAALVLGALVGVDPEDPATSASEGRFADDYTQFLDPNGLEGTRIGVARSTFGFHEEVDRLMEDAIEALRAGGAEIVDPANIETASEIGQHEFTVLLYEFKADLNAYLAALGDAAPHKTLEDLIAFNEANREREMPYFGQEIFEQSQEKGPLTEQAYRDALASSRRLSRVRGIDATMDKNRLDAILAPTGGPAWVTDLVNGDHFGGGSSSAAAAAGYPNVTVPAGRVHGLPVGISFFGRAWSEPTLIRIAYAFEQATRHRTAPDFRIRL